MFQSLSLLALAAALSTGASAAVSARPNVLIVMTDDQGYGDLSVHGNPVLRTPQLDRLHSESVRFTAFHVAPMCTPTRGQLLTGVDALRNGALNVSSGRAILRREYPTLAELLGAAGYGTGIFGKWHLGDNYPYRPQDRGFQETLWFPSSHISSAPDFFNNDYFDDTYLHNGARRKYEGYCTDVFFREAMAWMRTQAGSGRPFFCYLPLNAPHGPPFVPDRYREPYRHLPKPLASFFAMIANVDENMGRLDAFLREAGLRENTIVLFLTDNGTGGGETVFNAGMRGKKVALYDGGHRVPFFLRWPGGGLGQARDIGELAQAQDVLPTLLELCDVPRAPTLALDGSSLVPLLRGQSDSLGERILVSQYTRVTDARPKRGDAVVMSKSWRLVADQELYDIAADPAQQRNLIADRPEVATRLRAHYAQWWAAVEPRVEEILPVHLGSPRENPVLLSPCEWREVYLDQQAHVRGQRKNGVWTVEVERAGEYEFALRRWPIEADAAIVAPMPAYVGVDGGFRSGLAFPVAKAELRIGDIKRECAVSTEDKAATFAVTLPAGRAELQTWFRDAEGNEIAGAYYVCARKL